MSVSQITISNKPWLDHVKFVLTIFCILYREYTLLDYVSCGLIKNSSFNSQYPSFLFRQFRLIPLADNNENNCTAHRTLTRLLHSSSVLRRTTVPSRLPTTTAPGAVNVRSHSNFDATVIPPPTALTWIETMHRDRNVQVSNGY